VEARREPQLPVVPGDEVVPVGGLQDHRVEGGLHLRVDGEDLLAPLEVLFQSGLAVALDVVPAGVNAVPAVEPVEAVQAEDPPVRLESQVVLEAHRSPDGQLLGSEPDLRLELGDELPVERQSRLRPSVDRLRLLGLGHRRQLRIDLARLVRARRPTRRLVVRAALRQIPRRRRRLQVRGLARARRLAGRGEQEDEQEGQSADEVSHWGCSSRGRGRSTSAENTAPPRDCHHR
jgi:hypothetical protein